MTENEIIDYIESLFNEGFTEEEIRFLFANDNELKEAITNVKKPIPAGGAKPTGSTTMASKPMSTIKKAAPLKIGLATEEMASNAGNPANPVEMQDNEGSDFQHWYHQTVIAGKWQFPSIQDAYASYNNWCTINGKSSSYDEPQFKSQIAQFNAGLIDSMNKPKLESVDIGSLTGVLDRMNQNRNYTPPVKEIPEVVKETGHTGLSFFQRVLMDAVSLNKNKGTKG